MIIRSQDKKFITTDINLEIVVSNEINLQGSHIEVLQRSEYGWYESKIYNSMGLLLGTYESQEKAIKVLDTICEEYQRIKVNEITYTGVSPYQQKYVFQMPQDKEVIV